MRNLRMLFTVLTAVMIGSMVPGVVGPAGAGNGPATSFMVDPSSGPSPNTVIVSGAGCFFQQQAGGVTLGGVTFAGAVVVELRNKADTATLHTEAFIAEEDGSWSEQFPIPAGLSPGVRPMEASCEFPNGQVDTESGGLTLAQAEQPFSYVDKSYTVVAESEKADPVEAQVTLTG